MEDKLYAKDLRRAAKRLERKIEPDDVNYTGSPISREIIIYCPCCGAKIKTMTEFSGTLYCGYCGKSI